ncbi:MAG: asparagine synthetase B [Acidobacteriia bacterium]|nr:asparagine synthetase B [Terriglobia bacterium]
MSGFVGIVHFDGPPVDPLLLEKLTKFLAFRGPDAQEIRCDGPLGLGHALLQIPRGAPLEKQPATLGDRLWIVADARIDARAELIAQLKGKTAAAAGLNLYTPDAELILHAYDAWGEACVEHLLGDFTFAIWDARKQRLFCARDQMGVKQLYYANFGSGIIFSNTLNCIRLHPGVSNRLNDLAIADFLLFDANQEPATTSFADISQLPAAHTLVYEQGTSCLRRYWELPIATPIHFSRSEEYVERFRELLDAAVADRLRGSSAGVMMSGGLDSTIVAASAQRVLARSGIGPSVRAYTEVFDSLIPNQERHYATLAADALQIPIEYLVSDNRKIFERGEEPGYRLPMPMHLAWPDTSTDQLRQISAASRIALTGFGADPALYAQISVYLGELMKKGQVNRALRDVVRYLTSPGRLSRLYIRARWHRLFPSRTATVCFPEWLNSDLERKLCLRDRWATLNETKTASQSVRQQAHEFTASQGWASHFEGYDTSVTQVPVEIRHPFFDLRLLKFLLGLPALPWCCDKELLREAARGSLPNAVRLRRKSPMPAEPLNAILGRPESAWVDGFKPIEELGIYVSRRKIPAVYREKSSCAAWAHLRPLSLNLWLRFREF